jgi:hypothetical protein
MQNSISNSYEKMIGFDLEEQKKKDRASGKLKKIKDLPSGMLGYAPMYRNEEETYMPTESDIRRHDPNSAEFKLEMQQRNQEIYDRMNKLRNNK